MEKQYSYDAFISYRHMEKDKKIAAKLQKMLESYKPPKSLGQDFHSWRIFRDETELTTSNNLSDDIKRALENSRYLIVVCSEDTKASKWCLEEIAYFKELHNGSNKNIITLVTGGEAPEIFPDALCSEMVEFIASDGKVVRQEQKTEPLAANVAGKTMQESMRKLKTEFLRIAAPLLGCGYDALYNRNQKRALRRIITVAALIIVFLTAFAFYTSAMLIEIQTQKTALQEANVSLQEKTEELNQKNTELQKANKELELKTEEAQSNLEEAKHQKEIAEENLAEANRQQRIAEANFAEAERQRRMAENNLEEANKQRQIAEDNMVIAQNNEARANEANRNLRAKNAEILANQAQMYLEDDNVIAATEAANEALLLSEESAASNAIAQSVLIKTTGAYNSKQRSLNQVVKLSGYVKFFEISADGTRVLATDNNGVVYVIDYQKGEIIKTYAPIEVFDTVETGYAIDDICVEGNTGFVLCAEQLISIDLEDGSVNWHFNKEKEKSKYYSHIATNAAWDCVVVYSGTSPVALSKSSGEVLFAFDQIDNGAIGWVDYAYLDADGRLYMITMSKKQITVYDFVHQTKTLHPIDFPDGCSILSLSGNADCVFVNLLISGNSWETDCQAMLVCLNKSDMTVKWSTAYTGSYLSKYGVNEVFEFMHRVPDVSGQYVDRMGVVAVSECDVLAFDIDTGEIYFETSVPYEDRCTYCKPSERYSLIIGRENSFWKCYLFTEYKNENEIISKTDELLLATGVTFDRKRAAMAYHTENQYVLVSDDASELCLYSEYKNSRYKLFYEMPDMGHNSFSQSVDNGEGVFAGYYYVYDEKKSYIVFYDIESNKLLAHVLLPSEILKMCFVEKDTLMFVDKNGRALLLKTDGTVLAEGDILALIRKELGLGENGYVNTYSAYLTARDNGAVFCCEQGIFKIVVADNTFSVKRVCDNKNLSEYCVSAHMISFVEEDYVKDWCRIMYVKADEKAANCLTDNGAEATFKRDSVASVVHNTKGDIAFISKEGYIGVYRSGAEAISKIAVPQGEIAPLKILFTPDAAYIIALCSNGEFIKYSAETLEEVGRYKSPMVVNTLAEFEFVDENTFAARTSSGSSILYLIDIMTMDLKAEVGDYEYFMKQEGKILCTFYADDKIVYGYYDYLSQAELIEYANEFLSEMGRK